MSLVEGSGGDLPEVVDAHIMLAALDNVCVLLRMSGKRLFGRFGVHDTLGQVSFLPDLSRMGDVPAVAIGDGVRVEYWVTGSFFSFECAVHSLGGAGRIRLSRPDRIDRKDRRLVPRLRLAGGSEAKVVVQEGDDVVELEVLDLSSAGLAVRFDRDEVDLQPGASVEAWLHLDDCQPFPVELHVQHVKRREDGYYVAGATMSTVTVEDRRDLARAVTGSQRKVA